MRSAQESYGKAVEADPSFVPSRLALGNVYNLNKKPEDALKEYEKVLADNPRDQSAVASKVATLVAQNRIDDAIAAAQAAIKSDAKSPGRARAAGLLYARKNDRNSPRIAPRRGSTGFGPRARARAALDRGRRPTEAFPISSAS